jgi:hypothetical protein
MAGRKSVAARVPSIQMFHASRQTIGGTCLAAISFGLLCGPALGWGQVRPDFSGNWQQVNERCQPKPKDKSLVYRSIIDHRDPALTVTVTSTNYPPGARELHLRYETTGKELIYTGLDGDEFHTKVHWEGESLVFDTVEYERGHKVLAKEVWTLIEAGRTLKRVKEENGPGEHSTHIYVLEKQIR